MNDSPSWSTLTQTDVTPLADAEGFSLESRASLTNPLWLGDDKKFEYLRPVRLKANLNVPPMCFLSEGLSKLAHSPQGRK